MNAESVKCREAFEKWWACGGEYLPSEITEADWPIWQAAWTAALSAPLAEAEWRPMAPGPECRVLLVKKLKWAFERGRYNRNGINCAAEVDDLLSSPEWQAAFAAARGGEGFVTVPREPTPEMLAVKVSPLLRLGNENNGRVQEWRAQIYRAMLAASPEAPK